MVFTRGLNSSEIFMSSVSDNSLKALIKKEPVKVNKRQVTFTVLKIRVSVM